MPLHMLNVKKESELKANVQSLRFVKPTQDTNLSMHETHLHMHAPICDLHIYTEQFWVKAQTVHNSYPRMWDQRRELWAMSLCMLTLRILTELCDHRPNQFLKNFRKPTSISSDSSFPPTPHPSLGDH